MSKHNVYILSIYLLPLTTEKLIKNVRNLYMRLDHIH